MSSFTSLDEAESLVTHALRRGIQQIRAFMANDRLTSMRLLSPLPTAAGVLVDVHGLDVAAGKLVVRLHKVAGTVRVETAFLDR